MDYPIDDESDYEAEYNRQLDRLKLTVTTILIPLVFRFLGRKLVFMGVVPFIRHFTRVPQLFF